MHVEVQFEHLQERECSENPCLYGRIILKMGLIRIEQKGVEDWIHLAQDRANGGLLSTG